VKVFLISNTENPEKTCAAAALTSYWYKGASETYEKLTKKEIEDILEKVIGYGHISVIEHASFTFSIEGVSRACTHQLIRHRIASYTQQSQRYVELKDGFVVPKNLEKNEKYLETLESIKKVYEELLKTTTKEDARFILPNSAKTNIIVTMNSRELLHFFKLRCCNRAQWEIQEMAWKMLKMCKEKAPLIFENAGPPCITKGECPEGDLACDVWKSLEGKKNKKEIMKKYFEKRFGV